MTAAGGNAVNEPSRPGTARRTVGRYLLAEAIGEGGMATVHLGRIIGPGRFSRTVAIKRLRDVLASDPEFVQMFLDEARIAARVMHTNVVATIDVVAEPDDVILVMDYVHGQSLAALRRAAATRKEYVPPPIVASILVGALRGLHAAHETRGEDGALLGLVHRDVSPQNVMVGVDGVSRVLDFGIVVASGRLHHTQNRWVKGKFGYMSPEQIRGETLDRRSDVFAAGVVLWESLTGRRLFRSDDPIATIKSTLEEPTPELAGIVPGITPAVDAVLARALAKNPNLRFADAEALANALEAVLPPATPHEVGAWTTAHATRTLAERARVIDEINREALPSTASRLSSRTQMLGANAQAMTPVAMSVSLPPPPPSLPPPAVSLTTLEPSAHGRREPAWMPAFRKGSMIALAVWFLSVVLRSASGHGASLAAPAPPAAPMALEAGAPSASITTQGESVLEIPDTAASGPRPSPPARASAPRSRAKAVSNPPPGMPIPANPY